MLLQQTQAYPLLWQNSHMFDRQHSFRPGIFEIAGAYMADYWRQATRSFADLVGRALPAGLSGVGPIHNRDGFGGPPGAAPDPVHGGMPYPWEASDTYLSVAGINGTVNLANGNNFVSLHVCDFGGQSFVSFDLYYNSRVDVGQTTLPGGWRHSYSDKLTLPQSQPGDVTLTTSDGREIFFDYEGSGVWAAPTGVRLTLTHTTTTGLYTVTDKRQNQWLFEDTQGKLGKVINTAGNSIDLAYSSGRLATITQPLNDPQDTPSNNVITLTYTSGKLTDLRSPDITNPDDSTVDREFELEYTGGVLTGVSSGRQTGSVHDYFATFDYTSNKLSAISDYNDDSGFNTTVNIQYSSSRVYNVVYPQECDYAYTSSQSSIPWPNSVGGSCGDGGTLLRVYKQYTYTYQSGALVTTTVRGEAGQTTDYDFDTSTRLISITDPLDRVVAEMAWNSDYDLTSLTDVRGSVTEYGYEDQPGNVTSITQAGIARGADPVTSLEYDALNNVTSVTDPQSNVTSYAYVTDTSLLAGVDYGDDALPELYFLYGQTPGIDKGQLIEAGDGNGVPRESDYERGYPTCESYGKLGDISLFATRRGDDDMPPLSCESTETCVNNEATGHSHDIQYGACASCRSFNEYDAEDCPSNMACDCETDDWPEIAARGDTCAWTEDSQIVYDGNRNTINVRSDMDGGWVGYEYEYDVRNRVTAKVADYPTDCDPYMVRSLLQEGFGAPMALKHTVSREYSPIRMRTRTTYSRSDGSDGSGDPRVIVWEHIMDEAGRVEEITRDGAPYATYAYTDSTKTAAVTETKPVGEEEDALVTEVYVDELGQVRLVAHLWNDSSKAEYEYVRDANGRVTTMTAIYNGSSDEITTNYMYGTGQICEEDLDTTPGVVDKAQLYWNWSDVGDIVNQENMLAAGHPYKLVKEERITGTGTAQEERQTKEYFYDHGGNRISMREQAFETDLELDNLSLLWTRITRYDYSFPADDSGEPDTSVDMHTAPNGGNDYGLVGKYPEVYGRNQLSHYTVYCEEHEDNLDVCENVENYDADRFVSYYYFPDGSLSYRRNLIPGDVDPVTSLDFVPTRGILHDVDIDLYQGDQRGEFFAYDIYSQRVAKNDCYVPPQSNGIECDGRHPMLLYDYDLDGRRVAERRYNIWVAEDEFFSTYTYGPLGLISRTAEFEDTDPDNNEDYYYLADAMGNHTGLFDPATETLHVQESDAFGVHLDELIVSGSGYYQVKTGPYQWRGGEGSETDLWQQFPYDKGDPDVTEVSTGLVHMGFRYYEPETGRFTERDMLPFGNLLTWNPYTYVDNFPTSLSDPDGTEFSLSGALTTIGLVLASLSLITIGNLVAAQGMTCWSSGRPVAGAALIGAGGLIEGCGYTLFPFARIGQLGKPLKVALFAKKCKLPPLKVTTCYKAAPKTHFDELMELLHMWD